MLILVLFICFNIVAGVPSVCILQYDSASDSFSKILAYEGGTSPELYAFICAPPLGGINGAGTRGVNLLPSGSHADFRDDNQAELNIGDATINGFFTGESPWTTDCRSSVYYDYDICQRSATDRTVDENELFPNAGVNLRNPNPPVTTCMESRCTPEGTSAWYRTISSFTVSTTGKHTFDLVGMVGDATR